MRMAVFVSLLTLLAPVHALAQESQAPDWNAVLGITPNAPVKVSTAASRTIVGSFISADAGRIIVDTRSRNDETLPRADVREIRMRPKRSTKRSIEIGMLSGLAGGAVLGALACPSPCLRQDRKASTVLTSMAGGAVGFWAGLIRGAVANLRPGRLIYRSTLTPMTP